MNESNDLKIKEWNESYKNKGNFLFYPNEQLIRHVSKYYRKRIGVNTFVNMRADELEINHKEGGGKALDLGCGMGRHVRFLHEYGFEPYGIDLSETAIACAKEWFASIGLSQLNKRLFTGSAAELPFEDCFFDMIVSHGVMDSMYFELARKSVAEAARVLKPASLFFLDLISDKTSGDHIGAEDVTVSIEHEHGTIQSYYDIPKIHTLVDSHFNILEIVTETVSFYKNPKVNSRFYLVLEKR